MGRIMLNCVLLSFHFLGGASMSAVSKEYMLWSRKAFSCVCLSFQFFGALISAANKVCMMEKREPFNYVLLAFQFLGSFIISICI